NVEGQRFFAAGELEIEVRRQCESRTFVDIVGFGIDRNCAGSAGRIKDLPFPFLCSSAHRCAGVNRGIADGRDTDENRTLFSWMKRILTLDPGQDVAEDKLPVHRTRLAVSPIIDEQI